MKGQIDKWMIMKADDKMIIDIFILWTNVIFFKILFFGETPTGASYVDMREWARINDDLSTLCEHGDIEEKWREFKFENVKG